MQCEHSHFAHREPVGLVVDLYWDPADVSHECRVQVVERGAGFVLFPTTGRTAVEAFHHGQRLRSSVSHLSTPRREATTLPARYADRTWWTQTIAFTAVHGRRPGS
jgi:hypothetical protein